MITCTQVLSLRDNPRDEMGAVHIFVSIEIIQDSIQR